MIQQGKIKLIRIRETDLTLIGFWSKTDAILSDLIAGVPDIRWNAKHELFCLVESEQTVRSLLKRFNGLAWLDLSHLRKHRNGATYAKQEVIRRRILAPDKVMALSEFVKRLEVARYSPRTVSNYSLALKEFLQFFNEVPIQGLSKSDVIDYNHEMMIKTKKSASSQRQFTAAVKLFFKGQLETRMSVDDLEYARKSYHLPTVLSKEEVMRMVKSVRNDKHRLILLTLYAQGLRRAELLDLRVQDIDLQREQIHVRNAKGGRDRSLPLSKVLRQVLERYLSTYRPKSYLIVGQLGERYSGGSVAKVVRNAAQAAEIDKHVTAHTLRHSYATHCLELGMGLRYIQTFLGHKSPKTTMIYTHIRNDKVHVNPLDELTLDLLGKDKYTSFIKKSDHILPE
jgi:site-specific recombinase XerD